MYKQWLVLAYLENPQDFPMASACLQLSVTFHVTAHTPNLANNLRMTNKKKIEYLEKAMFRLYTYSSDLDASNLENFENLKLGIMNVLDENERIRFRQIDFHSEQVDFNDIMSDDLPF